MKGVEREFWVRSWLYNVIPLDGDCLLLATGYATDADLGPIDPKERQPKRRILCTPNPVAWTKTYKGARVFFTTLGYPKDFETGSMLRLLVNRIYWALGREVPEGVADVHVQGEYIAPPTH